MKISLNIFVTLLILTTNLNCQGTDPTYYGFSKNWKYLKSVSMKMAVGYSDVKFQGPNNGLWIVKMADTLDPFYPQDTMYFYHTSDLGTTWEKRFVIGLDGRPFWSKSDYKNHVVIHAQIMIKSTKNNPRKSKIFISRDDAKSFQTFEFEYLDTLYSLDKPNPSVYILNDSTYCLTTHQMVMISEDFGVNWKKCNLPYNGLKYYNIKNSCVVGNNIYLFCAFNQIYKSNDLGDT
jgi:hypothetical protein